MINYIIHNMSKYIDNTSKQIEDKQLVQFKEDMFFYFNQEINTNIKYNIIKVPWCLIVAEMRSESLTESTLSTVGSVYTKLRRRMTPQRLKESIICRLGLPYDEKGRDRVHELVLKKYQQQFP